MTVSLWQMPLDEVGSAVASARPAPAGVATASVTAVLGLSLLIKVLRITGKRNDLLPEAERLVEDLRSVADDDVAAVLAYIETRNKEGLRSVPLRASEAAKRALQLCREASGEITGLIAADVAAATALIQGASAAITACIAANQR